MPMAALLFTLPSAAFAVPLPDSGPPPPNPTIPRSFRTELAYSMTMDAAGGM